MRGRRTLIGLLAVLLGVWAVDLTSLGTGRAPERAAAAGACASLGAAADFTVFANGPFDASQASGTSISGRIAAAGDVTLDAITVGPAPGDATPVVVTDAAFRGGRPGGSGGTLNGGVRHRGAYEVAPNFTVNGGHTQGAPPFAFAGEFTRLSSLSDAWAAVPATPGATAALNPYSQALELVGPAAGTNVFVVDAADLARAQGIVITLNQPGATALIDVTTASQLTIPAQYLNLQGSAAPDRIAWNFDLATRLDWTHGVAWKGLVLAPHATVTATARPQLSGQLIAASVPHSEWVLTRTAFTGCLPPVPEPPDTSVGLQPECRDGNGVLTMRLRNTADRSRAVTWNDLNGPDFGAFSVPARSDYYFGVRDGDGGSVIRAVVDGHATVDARGSSRTCAGEITVAKATRGAAPAGTTWDIRVTDGQHGAFDRTATLAAGATQRFAVPGGYQPGAAPIGQVVGGIVYTISEEDPRGATSTTISLNPVEIIDGQRELVTVTNVFPEDPGGGGGTDGGGGGPPGPEPPTQPTLPPGAPAPPPGPGLVGGAAAGATDLVITHALRPGRVLVGGVVRTTTVVRNASPVTARGVVVREVPQYRPDDANRVARILQVRAGGVTCTSRRPLRCELGTLAPGAAVEVRVTARVLVEAALRSVVVVSGTTPETNVTNNIAAARVTTRRPPPDLHVHVAAPALGRVGTALTYRVWVTGGSPAGASSVRLCSRPPSTLTEVRAPGTYAYGGARCRNVERLRRGRTASFTVTGVPARGGRLPAPATATALGLGGARRALDHTLVIGPAACGSSVRLC